MKKILAVALIIVMTLTFLLGCTTQPKPSPSVKSSPVLMTIAQTLRGAPAFEENCFYAYDSEGGLYRVLWTNLEGLSEKDQIVVDYSNIKTITYDDPSLSTNGWQPVYEITATQVRLESDALASCLTYENDAYNLTLPQSGITFKLSDDKVKFVPYITYALVVTAEKNITKKSSECSSAPAFYLSITDDYLCLNAEVINHFNKPDKNGMDHEHLFYSERISSQAVSKNFDLIESDEEYGTIQFFPHSIIENKDKFYDPEKQFVSNIISDDDMNILKQVYNNGTGWTDDSFCDRLPFYFDGRIRFAAEDSEGWLYFGYEQNVLYYNGFFTSAKDEVRDLINKYREGNHYTDIRSAVSVTSGDNTVDSISNLLWSKHDNGDGTYKTTHDSGIKGALPAENELSELNVPELVKDGEIQTLVPVNCMISDVYLLDMSDRTNYPMTETTWEEIEKLPNGRYYIVTRVLISGNCDPDTPQHSYCCEDLFCLIIE